jgi:hypothetical protein
MRVYSYDIYSDDPDRPILAITAFNRIRIKVFDKDSLSIKKVTIPACSVVFNNSIMTPDMNCLALFSGMHEAGHITMQWHVFTGETLDGCEYDPDYEWDDIEPYVCCRRENIENNMNVKKILTAEDWREHHADYFGGAITMPNATFKPFVHEILRENNHYKGAITLGKNEDNDILIFDLLPDAISDTYGVSRRAARIKLRTSGFLRTTRSL